MPLHQPPEPTNGSALVQAGFERIAKQQHGAAATTLGEIGALTINKPYALYDLGVDGIVTSNDLAAAKLTGYQYFVNSAAGAVASAEVHTDTSGSAKLLATVNYGPYVTAIPSAIAELGSNTRVGAATYEVRILRVSAIYLMAIWLKPDSGNEDLFYPVAPAPQGVIPNHLYSETELVSAIMPLAKQRSQEKQGLFP